MVALSGVASAADLIVDPPAEIVATSSYDWSGFHLGVMGGGGWGVSETPGFSGVPLFDIEDRGVLLGAAAGVNQQWDNFVLGLEGDAAWTNIGGEGLDVGGGITFTTQIQSLATLRVRGGVAVDQALLYATGGLAVGATRLTSDYVVGSEATEMSLGWTVGAGVEVAVTDDVSLKAEYAYVDLGTTNFAAGALGVGSPATSVATTLHTVKVGANFHF